MRVPLANVEERTNEGGSARGLERMSATKTRTSWRVAEEKCAKGRVDGDFVERGLTVLNVSQAPS